MYADKNTTQEFHSDDYIFKRKVCKTVFFAEIGDAIFFSHSFVFLYDVALPPFSRAAQNPFLTLFLSFFFQVRNVPSLFLPGNPRVCAALVRKNSSWICRLLPFDFQGSDCNRNKNKRIRDQTEKKKGKGENLLLLFSHIPRGPSELGKSFWEKKGIYVFRKEEAAAGWEQRESTSSLQGERREGNISFPIPLHIFFSCGSNIGPLGGKEIISQT